MKPSDIETIELMPAAPPSQGQRPLLHDAGATAVDMLELGRVLGDAFADAAVLIPQGLSGPAGEADSQTAQAARVESLATLHLLHGGSDTVVPAARSRGDFEHLKTLAADATLDMVASVGHELHSALMDQAVTRLQICVPLRFWKAM